MTAAPPPCPPLCTPAATPHTMPPLALRDLRNLVRNLGATARPSQQRVPLMQIVDVIRKGGDDSLRAIAGAGAVPALVALLRFESGVLVHGMAAAALLHLPPVAGPTIVAAGAIPLLVQLLGPGPPPAAQWEAAGTLMSLASQASVVTSGLIIAADAIPLLVQLLGPGPEADLLILHNVAAVLWSHTDAPGGDNAIVAAGAIPLLVQLLGAAYDDDVHRTAAGTLNRLPRFNTDHAFTIAAGGAMA
ncbi:hypothetical protein FOA52_004574 [Chlamydomonas sp. UWO 241]|nr:hypothetical protein FOA52_004574 [Chlamydomonas sp. UWO 241]